MGLQAETVGRTLRLLREEQGLDLRQISERLRIRYPYLEAIENSLFDELPGPTYALGFVKAYSEHLGLDSDAIVEQFKTEQLGKSSKTELVFPSPLSEGRVPSAAILVVAVLLALGTYSAWMYFSGSDERVAEIVPSLPEKVLESTKVVGSGETQKLVNSNTPNKVEKQLEKQLEQENELTIEPTAKMKVSNADNAQDTVTDGSELEKNTSRRFNAEEETSATVETNSVSTNSRDPQNLTVNEIGVAPDQKIKREALSPSLEERVAMTYGDNTGDVRVIVRAIGPTWVEIRDQLEGEVLLTRVLYSGDRYLMPNREGLVMLTGNAGGLEISVDGKTVPALGPSGAVRRNILLDPDALIEGRAVRDREEGGRRQLESSMEQD